MGRFEWFTRGMFFKGIRVIAAFGVLLGVAGCASLFQDPESDRLPKQEPLVSVMITNVALTKTPKAPTGWAFYVRQEPSMTGQEPFRYMDGYHVTEGIICERTGGGYPSSEALEAIEAIDFEPFDWKSEAAIAEARWKKAFEGKEKPTRYFTTDGAEYEIVINSKRGKFSMQEWNPWPEIVFYAPYSEKIAKLQRMIETLASYMGRTQLGLY